MFKVTLFRPVQAGTAGHPPVQAAKFGRNAASGEQALRLHQILKTDRFERRNAPAEVSIGPAPGDSKTRLEKRFGDFRPATLMVLDELHRTMERLNLHQGDRAKISVLNLPEEGEQIMLEAAHDGIFDSLHKALFDLGAVEKDNVLHYADVPIHLYERGLEEVHLPEAVLAHKIRRESLAGGSTIQQAAHTLREKLAEQGVNDVAVHPLELSTHPPIGQLWLMYPQAGESVPGEQEQALRGAITRLPESELLDGKLAFRQGDTIYPIAFSADKDAPVPPDTRRPASPLAQVTGKLQTLWQALRQLLPGAKPTTQQVPH